MGRWRDASDEVIMAVIRENPDLNGKELRKKISKAYPFGERAMWPYKVWLSAVKFHLGDKGLHHVLQHKNDWYKEKIKQPSMLEL